MSVGEILQLQGLLLRDLPNPGWVRAERRSGRWDGPSPGSSGGRGPAAAMGPCGGAAVAAGCGPPGPASAAPSGAGYGPWPAAAAGGTCGVSKPRVMGRQLGLLSTTMRPVVKSFTLTP